MDFNSLQKNVNHEADDEERNDNNIENERQDSNDNDDNNEILILDVNQCSRQPLNISLYCKDVDDLIRSFHGSDKYPVERWVAGFEEASELFS